MDWGKVVSGIVVGGVLGIAGTVYLFNSRLSRVEALVERRAGEPPVLESASTRPDSPDRVILEEDFGGNALGWFVKTEADASRTIEGGKYKFRINDPKKQIYWAHISAPELPANVDICVSAIWREGDKDEIFGLSFYSDVDNYMLAGLAQSGYALIKVKSAGTRHEPLRMSRAGAPPGAAVEICALRRGKQLTLQVDGNDAGKVDADAFEWKRIGVAVWGNQSVDFDRLVIAKG